MGLLSERICWARKEHAKISQAALGDACGVSRNAVSMWESGETKSLDASYLFAAARTLGINPEWLATGNGEKILVAGEKQPHGTFLITSINERHKKLIETFDRLSPKSQLALLNFLAGL